MSTKSFKILSYSAWHGWREQQNVESVLPDLYVPFAEIHKMNLLFIFDRIDLKWIYCTIFTIWIVWSTQICDQQYVNIIMRWCLGNSVYSRSSKIHNIKDFRLISLVRNIYKLITKVLDRRMSNVMDKIIGEYQHVFMGGRKILDAALLAVEVVNE